MGWVLVHGGGSMMVAFTIFDTGRHIGCTDDEWNEISGCMGMIWNGRNL